MEKEIDITPVKDLQTKIVEIQTAIYDKMAILNAKTTIKNKKSYNVYNAFSLIYTILVISLTFMGSIMYMSGLDVVSGTKPAIFNILYPIIGLGSIPIFIFACSKTNLFIGIPLGFVIICVLYISVGLLAYAPIAFVNLVIQVDFLLFRLIPQIKFYLRKVSFRGSPYISKKAKIHLIIRYLIIAVCIVFLVLNLDKINMEQFEKVFKSIIG